MRENEDPKTDRSSVSREAGQTLARMAHSNENLLRRGSEYRRSITVAISVSCCLLFLLTSIPVGTATASGNPPIPQGVPNPNPNMDYIYNVSPSLFPAPSYANNLSSPDPVSLVELVALPSIVAGYGMINVSTAKSGASSLWFESGGYNAVVAQSLEKSDCSSTSCSGVPVGWNPPERIGSASSPFVSDALTTAGNAVIAAVSTTSTTYDYVSPTLGNTWNALGSPISGMVESLAATSTNVSLVTRSGSTWTVTTMNLTGFVISSSSLLPTGSGATGIIGASVSYVANGNTSQVAVAFSVAGSNEIQIESSTNPSKGFNSAIEVASFQDSFPNGALSSIGATPLYAAGSAVGEIGLTSVGNELFVAYASVTAGRVMLETEGSSNGGSTWFGPYATGPLDATATNLSLAPSPAGLVYATWRDSPIGPGGVEEAVYFPDGTPMVLPTPLPGSANPSVSATGGPSILVDALQRPVIAWPSSTAAGNFVSVTGDFLSANQSLALVDLVLTDPLGGGDFGNGASQGAFNSSTSASSSTIASDLSSNHLCNAQNATALNLYAEVTHLPLETVSGLSTTCGPLVPNTKSSPLVNSSGVDAPNDYLAVYTDWLLESEAVQLVPNAFGNNTTAWLWLADPVPIPKAEIACDYETAGYPIAGSCFAYVEGMDTVGTIGYSPTSFEIVPSLLLGWNPLMLQYQRTCNSQGQLLNYTPSTLVVQARPGTSWLNVSVGGGPVHSYKGTASALPWVYVTNLTTNTLYPYSATITVTYNSTTTGHWCGSGSPPAAVASQFLTSTESFSGAVRTKLAIFAPQMTLNSTSTGTGAATVSFGWRNSLQAHATVQVKDLNATSHVWTWTNPAFSDLDKGQLGFVGTYGHYYRVTLSATSRSGGWTTTELPALANGTQGTTSAQTASKTYGSGGTGGTVVLKPPTVRVQGVSVTEIAGTTAEVSWTSNINSSGYVVYSVNGSGVAQYVTRLVGTTVNGTAWSYTVQLHSLEPWTTYVGAAGIFYAVSVYEQNVSVSFPSFKTSPVPTVWEQDLPYDSISHTGGGAAIRWDVSSSFRSQNPTPKVTGGTLWLWNSTGSETIPVSPLELNQSLGSPWNNCLNITLSGFNQTYGFILQLNYSSSPAVSATSAPTYFVYQRDTSGDGLTDQEKWLGWTVVDPALNGAQRFMADSWYYSTNGLSNDYLEKEYDLNPNSVDTAGSGMLDLWNLTFDLGTNSTNPAVPWAYRFQIWSEVNSSFNPFSYAPYPSGPSLGGNPLNPHGDLSNLSCGPSNCPADSPYSAEVLWSTQALSTFLTLFGTESAYTSGDLLRGVLGTWGSYRTLTLWGKLSWGANPTVSSTPNSRQSDGSRVSPLGIEDLSLQVQNLYVTGLQTGQGYAAQFKLYAGSTPTGSTELVNYTAPVGLTGGISRLTGYTVVLPVNQGSQYQTLQIRILANESGTSTLTLINFVTIQGKQLAETNVTYDMFLGRAASYSFSASSRPNGSLSMTLQSVTVGGKTPTFLWLPTTNSTINGLPAGLERYTGEQAFDLVVVHASTAITSMSIPYPWGGSYTLSLQTGLNNLLFPREQFLNSSFAAAIFEGKNFPYPTGHPTPPILSGDSSAQTLLTQSFGSSSGLMFDLEAYWQNRSIAAGPGNFTAKEIGISNTNSLQVRTMVVQTAPSNDTGGLPSDPSLYTNASLPSPPALQTIITLNITSTATLDLLLSALLTNTTAGVNGTFQTIASQVASLGLVPAVLSALANSPVVSQGVYGPPPYSHQSSSSGGLWGDFWNAVSPVVTTVAGAIVSLVGVVYNAVVAAYTYLNHLAREAATVGGQLLARAAATLVHIGNLLVAALRALALFIVSIILGLIQSAFTPFWTATTAYGGQLASDVQAGDNATSQSTRSSEAAAFWSDFGGSVLILGLATAIVIEVVLTIVMGLSFGTGFLIGILIGVVVSAALQALERSTSASTSQLSTISGLNSQAVTIVEAATNSTNPPDRSSSSYGQDFGTLAYNFGWVAGATTQSMGWTLMWAAFLDPDRKTRDLVFGAISFAVGIAGLAVAIAGAASHSQTEKRTADALGGVSFALDITQLATSPSAKKAPLSYLNYVTLALDGAVFLISVGSGP